MSTAELYPLYETGMELKSYQLQRLNQLLLFTSQNNEFYQKKFKDVTFPIKDEKGLESLPFTTKQELAEDQKLYPPYGKNHSYPLASYVEYHQTSGTTGNPIRVLDTKESWDWWSRCWQEVYRSSGVTEDDTIFLAFSFGPFVGFWGAYQGGKDKGCLVIPGGGQSSKERLYSMQENQATVLTCTPSYALHLAEVAEKHHMDLASSTIKTIITAGEPGGSIPSVRESIEKSWGATLYDHVGMTEMGAYGYACSEQKGIHINEAEFIAEVIDPDTGKPVQEGERGELVLTNLGRYGYPLIRYRTGDIVINSSEKCACGNPYRFLPKGIVGRKDDMVVIRGINIFPQSIEAIVREFESVTEFRIVYYTENDMDQVKVQIEGDDAVDGELKLLLRERLGLRVELEHVADGALPRFEMKSRRVEDLRHR
ncbi:phenylacetate-CoA ligase [Alteribacillus persepolensis]|uniref:Phenylacetate-CoA ligase n=1 Tax=Alteribacillus persepolensis TaxID=568899 RepID=A0A1G8A979_9BACI|nr:AMP-binding protein [Alteribacillus persepolensis]SDH17489.1 phenylacetate-CoA ligase [Alteribacillus persepolensis]